MAGIACVPLLLPSTVLAAGPSGVVPQTTAPGGGGGGGPFSCSFSHSMYLSGTMFEASVFAYCNAPTKMWIGFKITSWPMPTSASGSGSENLSNGVSAATSTSCASQNNTYEMDVSLWINGSDYSNPVYLATLNCG